MRNKNQYRGFVGDLLGDLFRGFVGDFFEAIFFRIPMLFHQYNMESTARPGFFVAQGVSTHRVTMETNRFF